jgi:hypothetical protein
MARGWPLDRARKRTMLAVSLAMPLLCLAVTRAGHPALAIAALTALMFGHAAWGNVILPAEVFPPRVVATVSGLGGGTGALLGALSQPAIAALVAAVSFAPVFAICAGLYAIGFVLVAWLVPDLGRLRELS